VAILNRILEAVQILRDHERRLQALEERVTSLEEGRSLINDIGGQGPATSFGTED
jgi:hypothetical protein